MGIERLNLYRLYPPVAFTQRLEHLAGPWKDFDLAVHRHSG